MNKIKTILIVIFLMIPTLCLAEPHWYQATALTGGAASSLDSINGQNLLDNDRAMVFTTTAVYFYYLDVDSGASESSPDVISPDSNAGDKRWILIQSITP